MHHHFLDICGTAMGPLALDMARRGHVVSGSDRQWAAPIGPLLHASEIRLMETDALAEIADEVDVWVAGTLALADGSVRAIVEASRATVMNYPMLVAREARDARHRLVVAGTKGKTTTTAMLSHILLKCGVAHDWLIGGIPGDGRPSLRFDGLPVAVIEGDEYPDSADGGSPKFFHYRPTALAVTSLAPDHVDCFPDFDTYCGAFRKLAGGLPESGLCVVASDLIEAKSDVTRGAACRVVSVGSQPGNDVRIGGVAAVPGGVSFEIAGNAFTVPGFHLANAHNAGVAAVLAQHSLGIPLGDAARALADFEPPRDRLQLRAEVGQRKVFVESCAHPVALAAAVDSLAGHFPGCPITVVVQPQFPGGEADFVQRALPAALAAAERVVIAPPVVGDGAQPANPFTPERTVADLAALGVPASYETTRRRIIEAVTQRTTEHHIFLVAVHNPSRDLLTAEIISALQAL